MHKKISTSLVASLLIATNLYSAQELEPITVSSSAIQSDEKNATFATEIYTVKDIEKSKSKDIYDFLSSQTSVNVMPSYGNKFSQSIDMRGYGIENGNENIVVLVNGRRLNNIDGIPQLLSSISLDSVEKIEILKGSGSVRYGDGANAGVINIITNKKNSNYVKGYLGNNTTKGGAVSLGYGNEYIVANAYIDYASTDGSIEASNNEKDENYVKNKNFSLVFTPTDSLELNLSRTYANMNTKYAGPISLNDYKKDPHYTGYLTEQYFTSYVTTTGFRYDFNSNFWIDGSFSDEDKLSNYVNWKSKYEYKSFNTKINYKDDIFKAAVGVDGFDGDRIGEDNTTNKLNKAAFASLEFNVTDDITISTGLRRESVEYDYNPELGSDLNQKDYLNAYDAGVNYSINDTSSVFANYNRSFQAPNIDRFFIYGSFNDFIEPAKVNNYTVGYNNIQQNNKLKVSLFRTNLTNEIYYNDTGNWLTSFNTNIDKSHKYGFELFDKLNLNDNLFTSLNYSYIISKIDEENEGNGAYNGNYLPGVSKHNLTLALGYEINKISTVLSHTYKNSAYATNDFENNFNQKQEAYHSTDLALSYVYKNLEIFGKVQNLFDKTNGLWIKDDAIYPVNFERTFYAGMKVSF